MIAQEIDIDAINILTASVDAVPIFKAGRDRLDHEIARKGVASSYARDINPKLDGVSILY